MPITSPLSVPRVLLSRDSKAKEARRHILNRRIITQNKLCGRLSESNHLCWDPRKQVGGNLHRVIDVRGTRDCHHQILLATLIDGACGQLGSRICNPPNGAVAVLSHQQSAIACDGDPDRSSPNIAISRYKASQKIIISTGWHSIIQRDSDKFVSSASGAVP